jgi:hypothetical protein
MPDLYTENKEMVSAKAKTLVARVIQLTIKRLGKTDFRWGDIPGTVQKVDREKILDDASALYNDVKIPNRDREFVTENMSLDLPADEFLDNDVWTSQGSEEIWKDIHARKPIQAVAAAAPAIISLGSQSVKATQESSDDDSSDSSISSSGDDVDADHMADIHRIETAKLVTGKAKKSWVHVADPADDGMDDRWTLNCSTRLWRASASVGELKKMQDLGKPFCPTCTTLWPLHIKKSLTVATKGSLRGS